MIIFDPMQRLTLISHHIDKSQSKPLSGKTIVITGASRGIGLAVAVRCAQDGANIAILAKTVVDQPTLPGTIYTAAEEIQKAGGKVLPLPCDIRNERKVKQCIQKIVQTFGGIDILVNNASAINLSGTLQLPMKRFDLMNQINARGTFMVTKYCLPYLLKAKNPHILIMAPPLNFNLQWVKNRLGYSIAKFGMSMCVIGFAQEFKSSGILVNGLWPKTPIATAAVQNIVGGDEDMKRSRTTEIMGDAAYIILTQNNLQNSGKFYYDEQLLRSKGVTDFSKYKYIHTKNLKQALQNKKSTL